MYLYLYLYIDEVNYIQVQTQVQSFLYFFTDTNVITIMVCCILGNRYTIQCMVLILTESSVKFLQFL